MNDKNKVVLIGGCPMSGKSTVARELSSLWKWANISTDDIGEILQTVSDINPMKDIDYREYYIKKTNAELIQDVIRYHEKLFPAIERLIEIHSKWGSPIIIEGWALYPEKLADFKDKRIKKIWLVCDEMLLRKRLEEDLGFYKGSSDEDKMKNMYLKRSFWHNAKIKEECIRLNESFIEINKSTSLDIMEVERMLLR